MLEPAKPRCPRCESTECPAAKDWSDHCPNDDGRSRHWSWGNKASLREPLGLSYEGHDLSRADMSTIWSGGATPEDAIRAFCRARLGSEDVRIKDQIVGGDPRYDWGFRFTCDGTHFKGAGVFIPGASLLTWWK